MSGGNLIVPKPHSFHKVTLAPAMIKTKRPKSQVLMGEQYWLEPVTLVGIEGRHVMSNSTYTDEYRAERKAQYMEAVFHRNEMNVKEFLRVPPRKPGEFFTVTANYLWWECTWYYRSLEAALEDAADDCDPVSITGPSGVTVTDFMKMTPEQVRFILDGNSAPLSDGAL